ncbi:MAG TPA: hypothetical protein VN911_02735 [Candidatus Acidoferrum sp.]|nr:hypothetical protein [Candidatus Acidoferrum sp.]
MPGQILWDCRFLATQQRPELKIERAPEPGLLRAMQLDLRIREPIVERDDDTAIQDTDSATTEALAVLNKKEPIRNAAVLSSHQIGGDIWIHAHDAPGLEVWKRKCIVNSDLGINEMLVGL